MENAAIAGLHPSDGWEAGCCEGAAIAYVLAGTIAGFVAALIAYLLGVPTVLITLVYVGGGAGGVLLLAAWLWLRRSGRSQGQGPGLPEAALPVERLGEPH